MNRKQRNLKYIREKNHIRKGNIMWFARKITIELLDDMDVVTSIIERDIRYTEGELRRRFKLNMYIEIINTEIRPSDDDYIKGMLTMRHEWRAVWNH